MTFLLISIGSVLVLAVEWGLWRLFKRRVNGIHFPRGSDASQLRFFSLGRIRACAVAHAVFLVGSVFLFSLLAA